MMSITHILAKSLRQGFLTRRFIPLFSLYFLFLAVLLTFMQPVLKILPDLLSLEFTRFSLGIIGITFATVIILFLIILFINIWFVGALTYQAYSNKSFMFCLEKSRRLYWRLLALSFITIFITVITFQLSVIGNILRIIIDLVLFFVLPGIMIKEQHLILSIKKSFELFSKHILRTVIFWLALFLFLILIFLALSFLLAATATPVLMKSLSTISSFEATSTDKQIWIQIVGVILENYPLLYVLSVITAYFIAGAYTFYTFARTYFYLELLKKKSKQ
jgi:hypothetical protein